MTMLFPFKVDCGCCGKQAEVTEITSTNAHGYDDLDMRPPPMERDTLPHQVHACPHCGWRSFQLRPLDGIDLPQLVQSAGYRDRLQAPGFPQLARDFLAHAYACEQAGQARQATLHTLKAAWACDDADCGEAARSTRLTLLKLLDALQAAGEVFTADAISDALVRLDIARRAGEFDTTIKLAQDVLAQQGLTDFGRDIARFHLARAKAADAGCYTMAAVEESTG
ncbi:hypothetical protein [Luteimonas sp. e5]